jgi:hypothetical protein
MQRRNDRIVQLEKDVLEGEGHDTDQELERKRMQLQMQNMNMINANSRPIMGNSNWKGGGFMGRMTTNQLLNFPMYRPQNMQMRVIPQRPMMTNMMPTMMQQLLNQNRNFFNMQNQMMVSPSIPQGMQNQNQMRNF